jgi:hypothetical protein
MVLHFVNRDSSVGIVTAYRLDGQGKKSFSLLHSVELWGHLASYPMASGRSY